MRACSSACTEFDPDLSSAQLHRSKCARPQPGSAHVAQSQMQLALQAAMVFHVHTHTTCVHAHACGFGQIDYKNVPYRGSTFPMFHSFPHCYSRVRVRDRLRWL